MIKILLLISFASMGALSDSIYDNKALDSVLSRIALERTQDSVKINARMKLSQEFIEKSVLIAKSLWYSPIITDWNLKDTISFNFQIKLKSIPESPHSQVLQLAKDTSGACFYKSNNHWKSLNCSMINSFEEIIEWTESLNSGTYYSRLMHVSYRLEVLTASKKITCMDCLRFDLFPKIEWFEAMTGILNDSTMVK